MDLQSLVDHHQIIDVVNNLAICADLGKWEKLLSDVFAPEVIVDYTSLFGGEAATMKAKELVSSWRSLLPGFEATQHMLSNHQVQVNGDRAKAFAYVRAYHFLPNRTGGDTWVVGGFYDYELQRLASGWRVSLLKLNLQYTEGNQNLLNLAKENVSASMPEAALSK